MHLFLFYTGTVSLSASQGFLIAFVLGSRIQQFPLKYPPGLEWQGVGGMIFVPLDLISSAVVYFHAFY